MLKLKVLYLEFSFLGKICEAPVTVVLNFFIKELFLLIGF